MEHGYLDGQTPLDEEEKIDLIPTILTRSDLDRFEQENIIEARKWVMQQSVLARQRLFTERFLQHLHRRMFDQVWKWAGIYRRSNKNIGVAHYQIQTELRKLLGDSQYWLTHQTYDTTDLAIIFHHRLVQIHLFPNGNGRHARLCADVICAKYNGETLTWGGRADLVVDGATRKAYINALKLADKGAYQALLAFAKS